MDFKSREYIVEDGNGSFAEVEAYVFIIHLDYTAGNVLPTRKAQRNARSYGCLAPDDRQLRHHVRPVVDRRRC